MKQKYKHKFQEDWINHFSWIKKLNENSGFCKWCHTSIQGSIAHIKRHEMSEKHKSCCRKIESTPKITNFVIDEKSRKYKSDVFSGELKLAMFLHEHNLPFLLMDHLPKLLYSVCPDSEIAKGISSGRTKTTLITEQCLAPESLCEIKDQLEAGGGTFSLIIDETTDVSIKKSLAVVIRYCWKNKAQDRFLALLQVKESTSEALCSAVLNLLAENNISPNKMVGFAADNAAVMMGQKSGVQKRLRDVNKHIFILGCICHSLHLCSSAACKMLPKSIEEFVRSLYNHFSNSSKRIEEFEEFQKFLNLKPHKMLKPSQTRWLSLKVS